MARPRYALVGCPITGLPLGQPGAGGSFLLAAAGVRAAVAAGVARACPDHAAAAAGALDGVLPVVEERRLAGGRRDVGRLRRLAGRVGLREPRLHLGRQDPDLLLLLRRQELLPEPAE